MNIRNNSQRFGDYLKQYFPNNKMYNSCLNMAGGVIIVFEKKTIDAEDYLKLTEDSPIYNAEVRLFQAEDEDMDTILQPAIFNIFDVSEKVINEIKKKYVELYGSSKVRRQYPTFINKEDEGEHLLKDSPYLKTTLYLGIESGFVGDNQDLLCLKDESLSEEHNEWPHIEYLVDKFKPLMEVVK